MRVKMMIPFRGSVYVLFIVVIAVYCEDKTNEMKRVSTEELEAFDIHPDVENMIQKCQDKSMSARKLSQEVVPIEDVEKLHDEVIIVIDELIKVVRNSNNADKFLKAKGLDRIVVPNIKVEYDELKTRVLMLLKVLFEVAPTTTNTVIPIGIVDKVSQIFEDDNVSLKAHSLDVLYLWLPDNPAVQARIMKIKGLDPFYAQITNLDTNVIKLLLELFNKILLEHLQARDDDQKHLIDADKLKIYKRIGLLEHMSTPRVCNGLLNIFTNAWTYNTKDNNILMTVFDLLKNTKQFCIKFYRGKSKAVRLFNALHDYVKEPENRKHFDESDLNVADVETLVVDYIEKLKHTVKEEF